MSTKLYVGGLAYSVTDEELQEAFASVGTVVKAIVIKDRESGRSKGFGFVEMENEDDAKKAIDEFDGQEISGRKVVVNEARPQEDRPRGGNRDFNNNRRY